MANTLSIINTEILSEEERSEVEKEIDQLIARYKNNRYEINKLVFESVSALTDSNNYSEELHSQGALKRFWGGITGKNQRLRDSAASSLARSQYASQQTLQKLAEQNVMSFELITAVNNKLNASLVEVETEINKIYGTLAVFFKKTKSEIIQLESRVERLERNVNLLNWQSSIEYQMWDGVEYSELSTVDKIVCLVRDFYDLTKGSWTTSDLLLLKSAMAEIGLPPKDLISYKEFIKVICDNEQSFLKLFGSEGINGVEEIPEYVAVAAGIQKNRAFISDEKYILDNTCKILDRYNCEYKVEDVRYDMLGEYEKDKAKINIDITVNLYDFLLELLYNLQQMKELKVVKSLPDKMKEAELLFSVWDIEKAYPILMELSEYGVSRAKYLLSVIDEKSFIYCGKNQDRRKQLVYECIESGEVLPLREYCFYEYGNFDNEFVSHAKEELRQRAVSGDRLAMWAYGLWCINSASVECGEYDYETAIQMFTSTYPVIGKYNLAKRYDSGTGVEKNLKKAHELYLESAQYGYGPAEYEVGRNYQSGWGCEKDSKKSYEFYVRAEQHGFRDAINQVGWFLSNDGTGIEKDYNLAFEYFKKGAELNLLSPTSNVGWCYEYGNGVVQSYEEAIKYYKKAIEMGSGYSCRHLASLYLEGKGVAVDKAEARRLFELGVTYGDEDCKEELNKNFR